MKMEKTGSTFELVYKEDGVYLKGRMSEAGKSMSKESLMKLLEDKKLENVDFEVVNNVFEIGDGAREIIAPPQEEFFQDDYFDVIVSEDGMEARLILHKGENNGKRLDKHAVMTAIAEEYKVTTGVNMDTVGIMVDDWIYEEERIIAVGKPAVDGIDGEVKYHFETQYSKVGVEVDGRIDFKKLNMFGNVNRGDVVASKTDPIPGSDGYNVYGKVLAAKVAKEAKFKYGKNVFPSKEGDTLLAGIDGKADLVGDKIVVSKVFTVTGDVDMSVGNIDFNGDVVISGNVMSGFEIKAGGSVDVYGIVESSYIHADENIHVLGSFLGNGRGMLEAGGSVECKSVEQGIIKANISIEAENVMHSNLWCEGSIKVGGSENSCVMGGNLCSGKEIILNNVGNPKGTVTNLRIEMPEDIFQQIGKLDEENKKLNTLLKGLEKKREQTDLPLQDKVKLMNNIVSVQKSLEKNVADKERLTTLVSNVKNSKIEIRGRGFNGVNIYMDDFVKKIDFTVDYTTFYVKNGEIQEVPCK